MIIIANSFIVDIKILQLKWSKNNRLKGYFLFYLFISFNLYFLLTTFVHDNMVYQKVRNLQSSILISSANTLLKSKNKKLKSAYTIKT